MTTRDERIGRIAGGGPVFDIREIADFCALFGNTARDFYQSLALHLPKIRDPHLHAAASRILNICRDFHYQMRHAFDAMPLTVRSTIWPGGVVPPEIRP